MKYRFLILSLVVFSFTFSGTYVGLASYKGLPSHMEGNYQAASIGFLVPIVKSVRKAFGKDVIADKQVKPVYAPRCSAE